MLLTEEQGEKSYCIHEVHYDEDGSVMGWTQNAIAVFVPSFAELILQAQSEQEPLTPCQLGHTGG